MCYTVTNFCSLIHVSQLVADMVLVPFRLLSCVTEHLAAEIVQLTVPDISRALEWIKCSYLYVRMKKVVYLMF